MCIYLPHNALTKCEVIKVTIGALHLVENSHSQLPIRISHKNFVFKDNYSAFWKADMSVLRLLFEIRKQSGVTFWFVSI